VNEGPPLNRPPAQADDLQELGVVEGIPPGLRTLPDVAQPPGTVAQSLAEPPAAPPMPDAVEHQGNAQPLTEAEGRSSVPGGDLYRDRELTPMPEAEAGPAAEPNRDGKELEKRTVVELRKLAGELKVPNRSRLSKAALSEAIRQRQS
jgi:hypothetical protein